MHRRRRRRPHRPRRRRPRLSRRRPRLSRRRHRAVADAGGHPQPQLPTALDQVPQDGLHRPQDEGTTLRYLPLRCC